MAVAAPRVDRVVCRQRLRVVWLLTLCVSVGSLPSAQQVFRSEALLVPIDVRAVDRNGNPVTDLTAADFVVLEDGVEQQISHVITQDFAASAAVTGAPAAGLPLIAREDASASRLSAQPSRVFLVVLGRGRLQQPNRGLDAVSHLVERRLLPGDRIAVMAWNRATPFTNNHAAVADVVERFTNGFARIEVDIAGYFSGLAGLYRQPGIPAFAQPRIDAVFDGPVGMRSTITSTTAEDPRDVQQRRRAEAALLSNADASDFNEYDELVAANEGMTLQEFVASRQHTAIDVANIQAGIEYLRHVQGGLDTVSDRLLQAAASARVAVHVVHTGGLGSAPSFSFERQIGPRVAITPDPISSYLYRGTSMFRTQVARQIANETGGMFHANRHRLASQDIDAIDRATRFQYTLGYYSTDARLDARYRRIEVRVTRPGVTLHYRRGYLATPQPAFDRREIMAYNRIARAFEYEPAIGDIGVKGEASWGPSVDGVRRATVRVSIDASSVTFDTTSERHVASLDVAIVLLDRRQHEVGQLWERIELNLLGETHETVLRQGLPHEAILDAPPEARTIKVVIYDPAADKLGSVTIAPK